MAILNKTELQAAKSIINKGLQSAAESLSFFMKENITVEQVNLNELGIESKAALNIKYAPNAYLLVTEIVGELEGFCCLLFSEDEAKRLQTNALPLEVINDSSLFENMKDAILLEVDNIIAASVITQFANLLQRKIHGSVPKLQMVSPSELETFIAKHLENKINIINFKTMFVSPEESFSPVFIWFMNQKFIDDIKKYAANN